MHSQTSQNATQATKTGQKRPQMQTSSRKDTEPEPEPQTKRHARQTDAARRRQSRKKCNIEKLHEPQTKSPHRATQTATAPKQHNSSRNRCSQTDQKPEKQ